MLIAKNVIGDRLELLFQGGCSVLYKYGGRAFQGGSCSVSCFGAVSLYSITLEIAQSLVLLIKRLTRKLPFPSYKVSLQLKAKFSSD